MRTDGPPKGSSDDWFTPLEMWREWNREFLFTLDPAAHPDAPVSKEIQISSDIFENGLTRPWMGERVWCNPPFSDIKPWIQKAAEEITRACPLIVQLVPANRTEQPWWQMYIEPWRDHRSAHRRFNLETRFISKRFKFGYPGDPDGVHGSQPTFGCVLLVWSQRTQ